MRENEDGSLDTSRAATMIEKGHDFENGPIEHWVNRRCEEGYDRLRQAMEEMKKISGDQGSKEFILHVIGHGREVSRELLRNARVEECHSPSASRIAGTKIERPVLLFDSTEDYQAFYAAFTSQGGRTREPASITSRGFMADVDMILEDGTEIKIGIIVSSPDDTTIGHEIRHTIDPYTAEREGYDQMISELFAYYHDEVALSERGERRWNDLTARVWGGVDGYYKAFSDGADGEVSYGEYGTLVRRAVEAIRTIEGGFSHMEPAERHVYVQRMLVQTQTLEELLERSTR